MIRHPSRSLHDQAGLIGKVAIVWIVILLVVGLLVLDTISIVLTTFRLSSTAQGAASAAATSYHNAHDVDQACQEAGVQVLTDNVSPPNNDTWCKIDETSGEATITLKTTASSLVLGRLSFTRDFTKVDVKEEATAPL
jgi:Putative Flp pilus-assembly TadE/G-like